MSEVNQRLKVNRIDVLDKELKRFYDGIDFELQVLHDQIETLKSENEKLLEEISLTRPAKAAYEELKKQTSAAEHEKRKELISAVEDIFRKETVIQDLNRRLEDAVVSCLSLEEKLRSQEEGGICNAEKVSYLEGQLNNEKVNSLEFENEIRMLSGIIVNLTSKVKHLETEFSEMQLKNRSLSEYNERLESQLKDLNEDMKKQTLEISSIEKQFGEQITAAHDKVRKTEEQYQVALAQFEQTNIENQRQITNVYESKLTESTHLLNEERVYGESLKKKVEAMMVNEAKLKERFETAIESRKNIEEQLRVECQLERQKVVEVQNRLTNMLETESRSAKETRNQLEIYYNEKLSIAQQTESDLNRELSELLSRLESEVALNEKNGAKQKSLLEKIAVLEADCIHLLNVGDENKARLASEISELRVTLKNSVDACKTSLATEQALRGEIAKLTVQLVESEELSRARESNFLRIRNESAENERKFESERTVLIDEVKKVESDKQRFENLHLNSEKELIAQRDETKSLSEKLAFERHRFLELSAQFESREVKINQYYSFLTDEKIKYQKVIQQLACEIKYAIALHPLKDYLQMTESEISRVEAELRKTPTGSSQRETLENTIEQLICQRDMISNLMTVSEKNLSKHTTALEKLARGVLATAPPPRGF